MSAFLLQRKSVYKKSPERLSLPEKTMGGGSPFCERLKDRTCQHYYRVSSSTVHNIIKTCRESREISAHKEEDQKQIVNDPDLQSSGTALKNGLNSAVEITARPQRHSLSLRPKKKRPRNTAAFSGPELI